MVDAHIIRDQVYFSHRVEYVRATHASTITRIVVDIPANESSSSTVPAPETFEMFGRMSNLTGRVVETFERIGSLAEREPASQPDPTREATVPLTPGPYRLAIVVKNALSGETGVVYAQLDVPTYEELAIR